jgi:predicted transcriptional regulator
MLKKNDYSKKTSKNNNKLKESGAAAMHRNSSIFTGSPIVIAEKME